MPEITNIKVKPEIPAGASAAERKARAGGVAYAELEVTSNFSFLRSGSHPEELVAAAAACGCRAVAMTDWHTAAGLVRGHVAAKEAGVGFVVGCRVVGMCEGEEIRKEGNEERRDFLISTFPDFLNSSSDDSPLFPDFPVEMLLYPATRGAYGRMCRMLTVGKRRTEKGRCELTLEEVLGVGSAGEMLAILIPPEPALAGAEFFAAAGRVREAFDGDRLSLAARCVQDGHDAARLGRLAEMGRRLDVPLVATNDVRYHAAERRPLQDALTCVRLGCTLEEAGFALLPHAERHVKGPAEMARMFRAVPGAVGRTVEIAERARGFSLDQLKYEYPDEICPTGKTLMEHLRERTWEGAAERYGGNGELPMTNDQSKVNVQNPKEGTSACHNDFASSDIGPLSIDSSFNHKRFALIPLPVRQRLEHELTLIQELNYPAYFLTVDDIVRFARSRGILCQGRGAAANSAVCYCLGITSVDPARIDLLVERFISRERNEPPDIDIDFEHERREEVIQYIYQKYGRDRAALVAEVISYRRRSAIRDIGKALGLSLDCVDRLAKAGDWWEEDVIKEERVRELGLDPRDVTLRRAVKLAGQLIGFPRHLSQHVGGFVISRGPLCETVPIENAAMPERTVIEWDKDDIDEVGMLKVDCLGLGMLTCIRKAMALVNGWNGGNEEIRKKGNKGREKGMKGIACADSVCVDRVGACGFILENVHETQGTGSETCQDVSRLDCLTEIDGADAGDISAHDADAGGRTVRVDQSDATSGSVGAFEHCRRQRAPDAAGLPEVSAGGAGIAGGAVDAGGTGNEHEAGGGANVNAVAAGRDRVGAAGIDYESGKKEREGVEAEEIRKEANEERKDGKKEGRDRGVNSSSLISSFPLFLIPSRLQFHTIPAEDPAVYDMLCNGDSVGVFQVESRAQMAMLPRMRPRCYYDLVIEVAIVRPGPIQGGMVHPYLRRRSGGERVVYADEKVKRVLERTLGVPLFQEQAMRLVMVAAGFTAGEADQLRRAMAAWKRKEHLIERLSGKIVSGMLANGYTHAYALQVVQQIRGFSGYGFPESHAASFAHLVYVSAWLKRHHPAAFAAALINSQPMGFYQPAQIVRDAMEHGVEVRGVDVNWSGWDCRLEGIEGNEGTCGPALRLGMRLVSRMREEEARAIAEAVAREGALGSIERLWRASGVRVASLRALAAADAFGSMGVDRQRALWEIMRLRDEEMPLFDGAKHEEAKRAKLHEENAPGRHGDTEFGNDQCSMTNDQSHFNVQNSNVRPCARENGWEHSDHGSLNMDGSLGIGHRSLPDPACALLPVVPPLTQVVHDYAATGLSLKAHPLSFARAGLAAQRVTPAGELADEKRFPHGRRMAVAGLVLVRQRPSTASGILFVTLEDETGVANLVVRPNVYEKYRRALRQSVALVAWGKIERAGQVVHVLVEKAMNINELQTEKAAGITAVSRDFR